MNKSGSIENYNDAQAKQFPSIIWPVLQKDVQIKGFLCFNCKSAWPAALVKMHDLIKEV
jgi:NADPH-dependent curcumin reductase CurA